MEEREQRLAELNQQLQATEQQINEIQQRIYELWSKIDDLYDKEQNEETRNKKRDEYRKQQDILRYKEEMLYYKQEEIEYEILLLTPPIKENEKIDLRKTVRGRYIIFIHNSKIPVGEINYRAYHSSEIFGDIGYTVHEEFRGNNYAFEALQLLSELLYEEGIPDFWISTYDSNIPSLKTIEKYGGTIIKTERNIILFQCETRVRTKSEESSLSR
jgi:predicted acetyltransferase